MSLVSYLPTLNAALNATAFALLLAGYAFIRQGRPEAHKKAMLSALAVSALFLASYLIYHFFHGATPFPGRGAVRLAYFFILLTHVLLAAAILPLALVTLTRALRGDLMRHRRIARWTLPLWLYVSITGVVIYLMLYVLFPAGRES